MDYYFYLIEGIKPHCNVVKRSGLFQAKKRTPVDEVYREIIEQCSPDGAIECILTQFNKLS